MNQKQLFFPNAVISGEGVINKIPYWVDHFGGKRVLIATDENINKLGFPDIIKSSLLKENIEAVIWDGIIANPDLLTVAKGLEILNKNRCDLVIGIGGGSVMDAAKAIALAATNGSNAYELPGLYNVMKRGLPKILVPTTSGTGSEATQVSVLVDERTHTKVAVYSEYNMAEAVILDYELSYNLPPVITADTGIDALCHAVEAFVNKNSSDFTDSIALNAIKQAGRYLVRAYKNGVDDRDARKGMADASFYAGVAFCGAGLGAVHGLAYPLIDYNVSHGRSVGVFLPWVMEYNLPYAEGKYALIASALDDSCKELAQQDGAVKSIEIIKNILEALNIKYNLASYNVKETDIFSMAENAVLSTGRLLEVNPAPVSMEDAKGIYKKAF